MPRRPKKGKSSSLLLRKLVASLDPVEASLMRERIMRICELGKHDMKMHPEKYEHGIIAPNLLDSFYTRCMTHLSYENEHSAEKEPPAKEAKATEAKTEVVPVTSVTEEVTA